VDVNFYVPEQNPDQVGDKKATCEKYYILLHIQGQAVKH